MARFRFIGASGDEVELGSTKELSLQIERGVVKPHTLLFDSETGEWAPAQFHEAYIRLVRTEETQDASSASASPSKDAGPSPEQPSSLYGNATPIDSVELTPRKDLDEIDRAASMTEKLRAERDTLESADSEEGEDQPETVEAELPKKKPRLANPFDDPVQTKDDDLEIAAVGGVDSDPADAEDRALESPTFSIHIADEPPARKEPVSRLVPVLGAGGVAALILVFVAYLGFSALRAENSSPSDTVVLEVPQLSSTADNGLPTGPVAPAAGISATHMRSQIRRIRGQFDLPDSLPGAWLSGSYLADADRYPQVRDFWVEYLGFFAALEAEETAVFEATYRAREAAGVALPAFDEALAAFRSDRARRASTFAGLRTLAHRGLELHDFLVQNNDGIRFDPPAPGRVQDDPILQVAVYPASIKDELWERLGTLFRAMETTQGLKPVQIGIHLELLYGDE